MASSIVCSNAVVLLFYSLFVVAPIVCGGLLLDTCFFFFAVAFCPF